MRHLAQARNPYSRRWLWFPGSLASSAPQNDEKSITLHPCQLVSMKIVVAEQFLAHPRALHEEADVELVGHAHAAVHLNAFLHRQGRGRTGARGSHRDRT